MKRIVAIVAMLAVAFGAAFGQKLADKQVLIVGADANPAGIDPHKSTAYSSVRITNRIYETLVDMDETGKLVGKLAESWTNPNDTTYVFTVRKGVYFHNGREMTAQDVKYTFDRILDPANGCTGRSNFKLVESVNVLDKYRVEFKLSQPLAPFLSNFTSIYTAIIAKEVLDANAGSLANVACGTGPFKLAEWIPDNQVRLVKHDKYWLAGYPKLDGVTYMIIPDESARLAALRTGSIHYTTLSAQNVELVKKNRNIVVKSFQTRDYYFLGFNFTQKPFDDVKVRQAFSLAVDRPDLIRKALKGEGVIAGAVSPTLKQWAIDVSKNTWFRKNQTKAKALLAEAGYASGIDVEMTVPSSYPDVVAISQVLQQQLAGVGIRVTLKQMEIGQYVDAWKKKGHQVMAGKNGAGIDPDRSLYFFFHSTGSANVWGYSNPDFDKLVEEAKVTLDQAKRSALYNQAQEILYQDAANLFFASPMTYCFINAKVKGFEPIVSNPEDFKFATILK
ncbi:MAG: ABC transporter substrate-binding protein [Spirochaetes bacterium]|nr:ABC transporter substrate-binding protein [Spirochaetota bacterium]MBU1082028.1 ABC transporter substrate-binding protein [Spirochaetota bacterium]